MIFVIQLFNTSFRHDETVTSTLRLPTETRVHSTIDPAGSNVCIFHDAVSCMDVRDSRGIRNSRIGTTLKSALPPCERRKQTWIVSTATSFRVAVLSFNHWDCCCGLLPLGSLLRSTELRCFSPSRSTSYSNLWRRRRLLFARLLGKG